jgi:homoaconitate hydratase
LGSIYFTTYRYYSEKKLKDAFVLYKLAAKEPVSSTASIFTLEPEEKSQDFQTYKDAWRKGIWNVQFKQPQIQIVRPYTPLPPEANGAQNEEEYLRFLIRRDPHGEVSSYLHSLPIGSKIELRGPNLEYELPSDVKQVVFFAGGTGIAPALQVAHAMFEVDGNKGGRKLHILWANRKREDCVGGLNDTPASERVLPKPSWPGFFTPREPKAEIPATLVRGVIVRELEELKEKYPGQVTVEYYVNEEDTWIDKDAVFLALNRFDDKDFSLGSATPQEQRQILISGPSGFISYLAGPKEWRGGREEQGGVSKIIAHAISMNPHNVKVWKI